MAYCNYQHCSTPNIKRLGKAHGYLCSKSRHYHHWHHNRHHHKVHWAALGTYIVIVCLFVTTAIAIPVSALAATNTWDFSNSGDYTFDSNKIEFTGGVAQLKATGTPGTDWITNDGGGHSWGYRRKITFDNRDSYLGVTSESLADFPVLIKLTSSNIDYSKTQNSGEDVRFTDSDGKTELKYEIEKWDEAATSYVWVKVPQIDINSNTDYIYVYYGNASATDGQDANNVWDQYYMAVWHMKDNCSTAGCIIDSTSHHNNGSPYKAGVLTNIYSGLGQIGGGQSFDGISRYLDFGNNTTLDIKNGFTVETWAKTTGATSNYQTLANRGYGGNGDFWTGLYASTTKFQVWADGENKYDAAAASIDTNWHRITYTFKTGANGLNIYLDNTVYKQWTGANDMIGSSVYNFRVGFDAKDTNYPFSGLVDEMRVSSISRSLAWQSASEKSESDDNYRNYGPETALYPTTSPTIIPGTGQGYSTLSAFSEALGIGSAGTIKYQLSSNDGSTWYWYNGGAWTVTSSGYTESNPASDVNSHIADFTAGTNPKIFKWKAYLNSDGSQQPKLDSLGLTYIWDTGPPNNVAAFITVKSQSSGGVDLTVSDGSRWYNYPNPYFTWSDPGDTANEGETASGIANYYICFNTNDTCHPINEGTSQPGTTYTASNLVSGSTYYFRIRTKDNAGNSSVAENQLFTYKYDGDKPTNPHYISASPSGYSSTKDFSFIWPTANAAAAADTGGSGLSGYQYKINDDATWYGANHTGVITDVIPYGTGTIALPVADQSLVVEGTNTFYLRTLDNAGNIAASTIQVPFYFNSSSPTAPTGLYVDPGTNTANSFAFGWNAPGDPVSPIVGYYYAVNPTWPLTVAKVSYTTSDTLPAGAYATQQGDNYFYVVAKDEAGNANLSSCQNIQNNPLTDGCAKVAFIANTPAPGIPTGVIVNDQSIRGVAYKTSLSWSAPEQVGIGVAHYNIYRKSGSGVYAEIASPTDRYYLDEGVQAGTLYTYAVRAVDSAQKESANSSEVTITPRGKYDSPARIVDGSTKVENTSRTATVSWQTETDRDPYTNEIHTTDSMVAYGKTTNLESTAADRDFSYNHVINLTNLEPDTIYYYQVLGVDENGNRTEGNVLTFQTEKPTIISNVDVLEIRQTTAILKWESNRITTTELLYGKSTAYGSTYKEGDTPNATTHSVFLKDLDPGTQYNFQIQGQDQFGDIIKSDNYTMLKTKDFPKILNVTFQPLKDQPVTTVEVAWTTNVPTDGRVQYASTDGSNLREEYDGEFKVAHNFTIGEGKLLDQKTYLFKALVRDQYGNEATSDNQSYTTPEDTRAPIITNLQSEVLIEGSGDAAKVSAVITWDTDEAADGQVFYGTGTSGDFSNSTGKDSGLAISHLLVLSDLKPAQTYHVKARSSDASGNQAESGAQNFVTNQPSQSVVNIILTRLQQVFGWMTSINGLFGG